MTPWIVILGLAWGNPDSRVMAPVGDVIKIERVEVATEAECKAAALGWAHTYNYNNAGGGSGYTQAYATCAGQKVGP